MIREKKVIGDTLASTPKILEKNNISVNKDGEINRGKTSFHPINKSTRETHMKHHQPKIGPIKLIMCLR
jgi:hypothetical protein